MDSTDIQNALILNPECLPAAIKEIFSRMEVGDKLNITAPNGELAARFTLVENGEKVVHFAFNPGDSMTVKDSSNPDAEPVTFEMGEEDEDEAEEKAESPDEEKAEGDDAEKSSSALEAVKSAAGPEEAEPA